MCARRSRIMTTREHRTLLTGVHIRASETNMEEGTMQQGTWAGELQPPQAQTHVQYMDIQHYSQDPSYPVAAVPQQQQCFDAGSGFQAGQSPQVPQLHGFAGAFQQSTIPGMTVPPTPQTSGSMFMNTNIQSLPGSMPMGDVVNQPNLHPVHLDHQSSMVYPLEQTYHQNGWQDPHPHQRRRRIQPQQQRKQQKNQQRPQQHQQPRQKPKQKKKQAGDEGVEVAISSSLPGIFVDSSETMKKNKLMYDRMSPGGVSLDLTKFQQRNPNKWATSAAFELCKIMKPSTRPTYEVDGGTSKLNPPFTVAVTVNGVEYTPATAHSVKLAKQMASLNFVRELIGSRPSNVNIDGLKIGNVPTDVPGTGKSVQQQQKLSVESKKKQRSSHTAAALEMDVEVGLCSSLAPAPVSGKAVAAVAAGKGGGRGAKAGKGRAGVGGDDRAISASDSGSGSAIKSEVSKSVEKSVAPGTVGNSLEYDRMHPGGVELRNLRNLKTKDRPTVSIAYGLCNMMVPSTRPEFCFLENTGSGPFTAFIVVNGVKYTPATGSSIKIAKSEASINFIKEVVGDRVKLDLNSVSLPSTVSSAEGKGKSRVKHKEDDKEGSLNFLKLLHDLVTALPRTDSYTVFEWIPLDAANTKKDGKESVQRYCCVARLKLRVEDDEEGLKRSEEIKAAKVLFHSSEAKLSESPDDLAAIENWKSAQEKLTTLKAMPPAKIDMLKTSGEGLHKKDAKIVAARAMLYKLLPECKDNGELHLKAKSIIDKYLEEEAKTRGAMASIGDECVGKRKRQEATEGLSAIKDKTEGEGWTILRAALNNKGDDIDRLVAEGAILPKTKKFWKGKTLLHLAAEKGCLDATSSLIRHGLDVDIRDKQGRTCLHLAAEKGHLSVVRALLAAGADVHIRHGQRDCSAMDEAVCKGHVEIVVAIIRAGADPGGGDCTGYRALHRAAYEDRSEVVEALLDRGVGVDPRDDDDSTPVHFAAQQGSVSALGVLLRRGADPNAMDRNRDSPLHLAGLYLDDEVRLLGVVEVLLRWGANEEALNGENKKVTDLVVNSRVLGVLKRAPADRKVRRDGNWGRRRLVMLCRSRAVESVGDGKVKEEGGASGEGILERMVKVKEQKIFRSFVGFL